MLILYGKPSGRTCIKAKEWLQENNIPFIERNVFSDPLTFVEIKKILSLTENGTEDIISQRSIKYQKKEIEIDQLQLKDLYSLIQKKPSILKSPIIHDGKRFMVGFNESQIRRFVPKTVRHNNFLQ
ncbi:transcriptional regulator Spx [Neobacillus sp. NPDC097160]|uniref:transcriptional regulator Spx n=1 Tax=Neobacillus sp. NPDC097160 TaxID=3364298 RepID=UPI00382F1A67